MQRLKGGMDYVTCYDEPQQYSGVKSRSKIRTCKNPITEKCLFKKAGGIGSEDI